MWHLRAGTYELCFRAQDPLHLPAMQGNMWRGVLGRQLMRMSKGELAVPAGLPSWITAQDLYTYFMTTPPPPDAPAMRRYAQVPHPFAIAVPWQHQEQQLTSGETFCMRLRLFGRANELLNVIILALARAARDGLGKGRGQARLLEAARLTAEGRTVLFRPGESLKPAMLPALQPPQIEASKLLLRFESPLRIQYQGRLMQANAFAPQALAMNLVRRYSMLQLFHEGIELQADFRQLKTQAQTITVHDSQLRRIRSHRYSARQRREVPTDGLVGEVVLDVRRAPDVIPFLWLGQHVQAGKGTTLGLGQYALFAAS